MPRLISRTLGRLVLVLALLALVAGVGSAFSPRIAPSMMSMETMDRAFGIGRYQDEATCDFWVVDMENPTERIERTFDCGFYWDWSVKHDGDAYVHEVLLDNESGKVFEVPNMPRGKLEEWYHVDGHMLTPDALTFTRVDAGVLMPPPGARGSLTMGWVESGGEQGGEERVVFPRELVETGVEEVDGIPVVRWESHFERELTTWHGYEVFLTEDVSFTSDPRTAWILQMERHVLVEMTPSQLAAFLGTPPPTALPGEADEPQPIMELVYATTPAGTAKHVEEDRFFQALVTPIEEHATFARWGLGAGVGVGALGLALVQAGRRGGAP